MSHLGGRPKHRLTEHFLVLDEKANSTNKAAVCKYCIDHFGFQQACLISKVTNVVDNPETKAFFSWLGKFIKLPSCQSLSDRILKDVTKEITQVQVAM
ncbi:10372_t:CDS:2, partial [Racocetra persica]